MPAQKGINERQKRFCEEYMITRDAAKSYRIAYPNSNNPYKNAHKLLQKDYVRTYLNELEEESKAKYNIKKEDQIRRLLAIADSNIFDYYTYEVLQEQKMNYDTGKMETKEKVVRNLKTKDELTQAQMMAVKKITRNKLGEEEVELYGKDSAINELNKIMGFLENNVNLDTRIDTSKLKNLEFKDLLQLVKADTPTKDK